MDKIKNLKFSKLILLLIMLSAIGYPLSAVFSQHEGHQMPDAKQEPKNKKPASTKAVYYCPMHPGYTSDKPGDCPICNMKLVKKAEEEVKEDAKGQAEGVYISPEKQQLIGVKTDKVIYRSLSKVIRTVGRVAFDPELYKAQTEYIEALKSLEKLRESGQEVVIKRAEALISAAELKLKLQGLDIEQIQELQKAKESDTALLISSVDSEAAWVYATIYEYELEWVKVGQEALITAVAYPGQDFKGKIVAIDPVFDAQTRSVRARIKVENNQALLKPQMYVDVQFSSDLGAHLAVPKEAILDSGLRKIVFLVQDNGHFKSVEIKSGFANEEYAQVLEGLSEGDMVVVSGNFLIDSESKLKSALEGTTHQHGQ